MRPSKLRHPLAVLRKIIGLQQKELADLAECSAATIQSIELKRLALSEELAERISDVTGADVVWLLKGDPRWPIDGSWLPYHRNAYEGAQQRVRMDPVWQSLVKNVTLDDAKKEAAPYAQRLAVLILKAIKRGRRGLVMWQVNHAIKELEKRYEQPYQPVVPVDQVKKKRKKKK